MPCRALPRRAMPRLACHAVPYPAVPRLACHAVPYPATPRLTWPILAVPALPCRAGPSRATPANLRYLSYKLLGILSVNLCRAFLCICFCSRFKCLDFFKGRL